MKSNLRVNEVSQINDSLFQEAYRIYDQAFPPEEKISSASFTRILESKKQGRDRHIIVASNNELVIGMAVFSYLQQYNIGFIAYIVIRPEAANRGNGSSLYKSILAILTSDAKRQGELGPDAVFSEVEKSELAETAAQEQINLRRISFFKSVGCQIINSKYFQPSLGDGLPSVEMNLMVHLTKPGLKVTREWLTRKGRFDL